MKWFEIIVNTNSESTDLVADAFFTIGCTGGVKIVDKNDVLDIVKNAQMWDYIDEELFLNTEIAKVSGFVSAEEREQKLQALIDLMQEEGLRFGEINVEEIDDESWYENWKKFYSPILAGKYVVVPKWLTYPDDGQVKILIDPGMAFGTGEHESTKMCLMLMSDLNFTDKSVIDVGTGSGILGIGAVKSGAKSCYMCDIDSIAVRAAQENVNLNNLSANVEVESADLLQKNTEKADIVLANLTADILIRLSKGLTQYIKNGGHLVCSGIIHSRKADVIDAFVKVGFTLEKQIEMGEWDGLLFAWI